MAQNPTPQSAVMALPLNALEEAKLWELAYGIAKDIEDLDDLLKRLDLSRDDYDTLCATRTFKAMLGQAISEWQGASHIAKRIKLKAAVNVEQSLPAFYQAMVNPNESLAARVKVLEIVSRIGGLGQPEPIQGNVGGSAFNLTIQLDGRAPVKVFGELSQQPTIDVTPAQEEEPQEELREETYSQSQLLQDDPFEELSPSE